MPRPYLIVDGYNLMHAAGFAQRSYATGQLARCRSRLLRFLVQHLRPAERERTTIVFDAADAPTGRPRQFEFDCMTVAFAPPGQDADALIEGLIAEHSAPRQIRLISSDHRLQNSARRRRGSFIDSEDFVDELHRRGPDVDVPPQRVDRPRGAPASEADEDWHRIFADAGGGGEGPDASITQADVSAIKKEVDGESVGRAPRRRRKKP